VCQFCTKHGEGKKWYLQMKNYSDELLHAELSAEQKELAQVQTRPEWMARFIEGFVVPAVSAVPKARMKEEVSSDAESAEAQPSEDEVVARAQAVHFGQVLPVEDLEQVVDIVDSITRMPCGCRYLTTGKEDKRYCFGLGMDRMGILGKFPEAASSLEVLEKEEAKKIFHEYDREGLMHSIWTGITPYVVGICNCDRDCGAYKWSIEERGAPSFFRAEYIAQSDWDLCTGCKSCMKQCQFGAMFYSSALAKVYIDPTRCFGCGVCRAACKHDAISLLPREKHPEAAELWLGPVPK